MQASFGAFTSAVDAGSTSVTPSLSPSPSSAPPSLHSSFKMTTDGFMGFASASAAEDSDEVDPFAEAGLAAPEEVPLAEALAAWGASAGPTEEDDGDKGGEDKQDGEEGVEGKQVEAGSAAGDDLGAAAEKIDFFGAADQATPTNLEPTALNDWQHVGFITSSPLEQSQEEEAAAESPATTNASETADDESFVPFSVSMDHGKMLRATKQKLCPLIRQRKLRTRLMLLASKTAHLTTMNLIATRRMRGWRLAARLCGRRRKVLRSPTTHSDSKATYLGFRQPWRMWILEALM